MIAAQTVAASNIFARTALNFGDNCLYRWDDQRPRRISGGWQTEAR
jgi:hypothetical protein